MLLSSTHPAGSVEGLEGWAGCSSPPCLYAPLAPPPPAPATNTYIHASHAPQRTRYLAPPFIILRRGLIAGSTYPSLATHMASFLAATLFSTSLIALDSATFRRVNGWPGARARGRVFVIGWLVGWCWAGWLMGGVYRYRDPLAPTT